MKDLFQTTRVGDVNRDFLFIQLPREVFELRGRRNQNNLGLKSNDPLDARVHRVADFRDVLRFRGVIAVNGIANQTISRSDRVNNLG